MSILRRNDRGDLFVHVNVETPVNLTAKQKSLIEEFDKIAESTNNSPNASKLGQKLKDFWNSVVG